MISVNLPFMKFVQSVQKVTKIQKRLARPTSPVGTSNGSLNEISGTVSLSFQSSFQLSLTVLVCYWSLANIQPWKQFTSQFGMQSQASLLTHSEPYDKVKGAVTQIATPSSVSITKSSAERPQFTNDWTLGYWLFTRRYYANPSQFSFLLLFICLNPEGNLP